MNIDKKSYKKYAEAKAAKSKLLPNCLRAFWVGGAICTFSQLIKDIYMMAGIDKENASTLVSVTIIFIAICLTAVGIFDNIGRYAGAGTLVPICGFANSVVSPALDTKSEGWVLGVGAKIFTIAGPVLLYSILASVIYGVILYIMNLIL